MLKNTRHIIKQWERSLDIFPRTQIDVVSHRRVYEPQVTVISDGYIEYCNHVKSSAEIVTVLPDDSQCVIVCTVCKKQYINGEWV